MIKKENTIISGIEESFFECQRDGLTIRGTHYRPKGESLPIAIVSHGFMAFQDTVRQYTKELARLGYTAFCFDFCGGSVIKGKSDGKTTEMSVLTEVKDLEAVMNYAKSLPYTKNDGILLMGCSQGGFVSALTAVKRKAEVSKLILFYPALCIPDDARAGKMMFARFDPKNIPERISCGPMKLGRCYVSDVIGMGPYEEIMDYLNDVLIVHGTKDRIVKLDYSCKAYEVYKNTGDSNRRVVFKMLEGGAHGFSRKHDAIAMEWMREFVEEQRGKTYEEDECCH